MDVPDGVTVPSVMRNELQSMSARGEVAVVGRFLEDAGVVKGDVRRLAWVSYARTYAIV